MISRLIHELESSRTRTVGKLDQLELECERLLGRLEGIDVAIGSVRALHLEELQAKRLEKELSEEPIVFDVGEDFDDLELEEDELAQVIQFKDPRTLSDAPKPERGHESLESSDELTDPLSRESAPLPRNSSGPKPRKRQRARR